MDPMAATTLRIRAIDAHVAGSVLRLVTGGLAAPEGASMREKASSLELRHGAVCDALLSEPRAHDGTTLAVLCEPVDAASDAGVLFRRRGGLAPFGGQNLIALATIALERGLVFPREEHVVRLDTTSGSIAVACEVEGRPPTRRVVRAAYVGPPAFVLAGGVEVTVAGRRLRADVAHGGELFVILDSESAGVALTRRHLPELLRVAVAVQQAASATLGIPQAEDGESGGLPGVIFTGPPSAGDAQLRCQVVYADGTADRSPSGAAIAALLGVLDAMGLASDEPLVFESMAGTSLTGRVLGPADPAALAGSGGGAPAAPADGTGERAAAPLRVEVSGRAWILADLELLLDASDPLRDGLTW
jgi:4-hydroxyproline epimerase